MAKHKVIEETPAQFPDDGPCEFECYYGKHSMYAIPYEDSVLYLRDKRFYRPDLTVVH